MPDVKTAPRLRFRTEVFDEIARAYGLVTDQQKAAYLGVEPSTYSRVVRGLNWPGEAFVAAVLAARKEATFERLFEVVEAS